MIVRTYPSCYEAFILVHKVEDWWFKQFCLDKHVELVKYWNRQIDIHVEICSGVPDITLKEIRSYADNS